MRRPCRVVVMSVCRSCEAPIRWVETVKGRPMPLDAEPVADGNVTIETSGERRGPVAVVHGKSDPVPDGTPAYRSHFSTCPFASKHRGT